MRETLAGHHDYVAGDGRVKARCTLTNITDLVWARATHLRLARALTGLACKRRGKSEALTVGAREVRWATRARP